MIKNYLTLFGMGISILGFSQNSLLSNPTTGALPDGRIDDIELCGNGVDQVLIAASQNNKQLYAIDIDDNDWGAAASNTVTSIPDFQDLIEGAVGESFVSITNIEVNRISKAVYVLANKGAGPDWWIVKIEDDGATVSVLDPSDQTYSIIEWGTSAYDHQDMTWGDNTLFVTSGSWTLDGEAGQVTAPFEHNSSLTMRSTSMFKTNWGGGYFTAAPLEKIEFANMNSESRLMGVTVCAPGFSIETSELTGGGILQIEELFNVRYSPPEKVVHQNQGGTHYLFDLHSPSTLIRIGEEYIDGSRVAANEHNFNVTHLRTTGGAITGGLTDDQAKLYTEDFDMISFWDDYNLLVLESDVLHLFETGTYTVGAEENSLAKLDIAPNPASEFVNLTLDMDAENADLTIHNMNGQIVYNAVVSSGQTQIDTKEFAQGTYIVKLTADNNLIYTDKLIIK